MTDPVIIGDCTLYSGDCLQVLPTLPEDSVDSCVTDPPYHFASIVKRFGKEGSAEAKDRDGLFKRASKGFMGKKWDGGNIAFRPETWEAVYRVLKPGAHLLAFGAPKNFGFMQVAIAEAGFEIRDTVLWLFGSGFPKSHDISKAIDKAAGEEREILGYTANSRPNRVGKETKLSGPQTIGGEITIPVTDAAREWEGWGTALKPAAEFICLARKPLSEPTVAANVLRWGTGAINIDACRVPGMPEPTRFDPSKHKHDGYRMTATGKDCEERASILGRWPANVIHDGSEEVIAAFPQSNGQQGVVTGNEPSSPFANIYGDMPNRAGRAEPRNDSGSAARFFYSAKADKADRCGSKHPTVKPVDLMAYLCRLVTPPGGTVIDPFAGSGTTAMACIREGFDCILIEREAEYVADIKKRLAHVRGDDTPLFTEVA